MLLSWWQLSKHAFMHKISDWVRFWAINWKHSRCDIPKLTWEPLPTFPLDNWPQQATAAHSYTTWQDLISCPMTTIPLCMLVFASVYIRRVLSLRWPLTLSNDPYHWTQGGFGWMDGQTTIAVIPPPKPKPKMKWPSRVLKASYWNCTCR